MTEFEQGLVSIVTPVYNGEKYIRLLLNSVLSQTYDKLQMIVADDGSEDGTVAVAESFRPLFEERGYALEVVSGTHSCAAGAMCTGLPYVKGEYLIWPDGDDEIMPESVEKRVAYLQEHPEVKCVRSNRIYVDMETGEEVNALERTGDLTPHNIFLELLKGETYVCCGCYMLRSNVFFEIYQDGQIPVYGVGQNFQMLLPYLYHHDCHTIDLPLYKVNRRLDSHSARLLTKEQEYKKYNDYESLLDDIIHVAKITDEEYLRQIKMWKYNRQKDLFRRHKDFQALRRSHNRAYKAGLISGKAKCKALAETTVGYRAARKVFRKIYLWKTERWTKKRNRFLKKQRDNLKTEKICLICNNCLGGAMLHDLDRQFCSPFVNLLVQPKDFIKMLKALPEYMAEELVFFKQEGINYPVAMLKDIPIYFMHYDSETEAREKWVQRTARMDYEHLYILFSDRNGATEQDIKEFDSLPYAHKAVLVHKPMPDILSAVYMKGYEDNSEIGMLISYKSKPSYKKKYDDFDYVSWLNS